MVVGSAGDPPSSSQRFVGPGSADDRPGSVVGEDVRILGRGLGDRGTQREGPERAVEPLRDVDGDEVGSVRGSRITLEFTNAPDSGIAPVDEKLPGKDPNGFRVSIVTAPAFGMAGGRRPSADRLERLDEQAGVVRDGGGLPPDDLPASAAPLVERGGPCLVGEMGPADDEVERRPVAQGRGIAGQPHRDRRAGLEARKSMTPASTPPRNSSRESGAPAGLISWKSGAVSLRAVAVSASTSACRRVVSIARSGRPATSSPVTRMTPSRAGGHHERRGDRGQRAPHRPLNVCAPSSLSPLLGWIRGVERGGVHARNPTELGFPRHPGGCRLAPWPPRASEAGAGSGSSS